MSYLRNTHMKSIRVTWWCPTCEADHEVDTDYIEVDSRSCPCCSDENFIEARCPVTDEKFRVGL